MFRLLTFGFIAIFAIASLGGVPTNHVSAQSAQAQPDEMRATPEILALFDESLQSLAQVEPNQRASGLFQLLNFAVHLDNKAPARQIISALAALAGTIESVELRDELYIGIAHALCDLEEFAAAIEASQRIANPTDRYSNQLDLAVRIVVGQEQNEIRQAFDATGLLRQVITSATEAQDRNVVAMACSLLGRELARQGKTEESVTMFAEALRIARGIENVRERVQALQLILQSQVRYGKIAGAQATALAIDDPEIRRSMTSAFILALIEAGQLDEAERLIRTLPADGAGRDVFIQRWIVANIDSITDEKIGSLATLLSDAFHDRLLQAVVAHLQTINRGEVAVQVSRRVRDTTGAEWALLAGRIDFLLREKQFAEAIQFIDASGKEDGIRQHLKRRVLIMQFDETRDDAIVQQILATHSSEDRIALSELREEASQASRIANIDERMGVLFEIVQDQFLMMDFPGARQTAQVIAAEIDNLTDPVQIIDFRLMLAEFQVELQDNAGVRDNLGKLMQRLAAVPNLMELKDLVPPQEAPGFAGNRIAVDSPVAADVSEQDIRRQLFRVYVMTSVLLARADAIAESNAAFERAKALARQEANATLKSEKLLMLAQFLAER